MTDPFHPLSVRDIPLLTHYFARQDTRLCNASAGAAVLWQPYFQDAALEVDGTLLLREQFPGLGTVFSTPIGENVGNAYDFLVKYCRAVGQPVQFFPATAADVENLCARFGDVEVTPVRDWFDYLYDAQDMVTFRGRRFNGQRNHVTTFSACTRTGRSSASRRRTCRRCARFLTTSPAATIRTATVRRRKRAACGSSCAILPPTPRSRGCCA